MEGNALSFDNTPRLAKDAGICQDILTPLLTEDFNFTTTFKDSTTNLSTNTWNHTDTTFNIAPVNSTTASPWDENQFAPTTDFEPIQPGHNIYHSATTPGSDAHRQQWLYAELCDSLHAHPIGSSPSEWDHSGSPRVPTRVKPPLLDEVAMRTAPRKKAKTCPQMKLMWFYCSKCQVDNAKHFYEDCPT